MGIKLPTQGVGWESLIVIKQEARFKPLPMPKMYSLAGTTKSRHFKKGKRGGGSGWCYNCVHMCFQ
jgi:hypothetical protein